nr:hypothetical protein [Tanacetum cinerariifolium]
IYELRYVAIVVRVTETLENEGVYYRVPQPSRESLTVCGPTSQRSYANPVMWSKNMQAATDLNNRAAHFVRQCNTSTTQLENNTGTSCSHDDRATLLATGAIAATFVCPLDVIKKFFQIHLDTLTSPNPVIYREITASGSNLTSKRAGNMIIDQPKSISLRELKFTHNNK